MFLTKQGLIARQRRCGLLLSRLYSGPGPRNSHGKISGLYEIKYNDTKEEPSEPQSLKEGSDTSFKSMVSLSRPNLASRVFLKALNENDKSLTSKENTSLLIDKLTEEEPEFDLNSSLANLRVLCTVLRKQKNEYRLTMDQINRIVNNVHQIHLETGSKGSIHYPGALLEDIVISVGERVAQIVDTDLSYYCLNEHKDLNEEEEMKSQMLFQYLHLVYEIVKRATAKDDADLVVRLWRIVLPFHTKLFNSLIQSPINNSVNYYYHYSTLGSVIQCLSKQKRYRGLITMIIADLPVDSIKLSTNLMSALLFHAKRSRDDNLAKIIISQYDFKNSADLEKVSREEVDALFASSISRGDYQQAQLMVDILTNQGIDINEFHFDQLFRAILYSKKDTVQDRASMAWQMIERWPRLCSDAMLTYLDFMISNKAFMDLKKLDEIYEHGDKLLKRGKKQWFDRFNVLYFKFLVRNYPLYIAIDVYQNSKYHKPLKDFNMILRTNPFKTAYNKVQLKLTPSLKRIVLRDIYSMAYRYYTLATAHNGQVLPAQKQVSLVCPWVLGEMHQLRTGDHTHKLDEFTPVAGDLVRVIKQQARKVGFELKTNTDDVDMERLKFMIEQGEKILADGKSLHEHYLENLKRVLRG